MTNWGVWNCKHVAEICSIPQECRCNWQHNKSSKKGSLCLAISVGQEKAIEMRGTRTIETDTLCYTRLILNDSNTKNKIREVFRMAAASEENVFVKHCVDCKGYDGACPCYSPQSKAEGERK